MELLIFGKNASMSFLEREEKIEFLCDKKEK